MNKVFLCVGTSKCIGDSLGPIVGENLNNKINKSDVYVFGNLRDNITNKIDKQIKNPYLIVVDSALSSKKHIGRVIISKNKMVIGKALNKLNYSFGNICIKGVVGENKNNCIRNYNELNNVQEKLIQKLSIDILNKILYDLNV